MVWHNNTVLIIYNKGVRTVACPSFTRCLPRGCVAGRCRVSLCLPLQMRSAPRGGGGKAAAGWKKLGKAYGRRVKIEKIRKSRKKTGKKFGNPAKSVTFAVPFPKGASVPPPRIGGSSLNRKKEARAGPASPAPSGRGFFVPGRCKERRRKSYYTMKSLILAQDER